VTGQVEDVNKLLDYINEAWMDLQLLREDWMWMRASAQCVTVAGQALYSPTTDFALTDFANWNLRSFRNYSTAAGLNSEITMDSIDYDDWRDTYNFGANRNTRTRPIEFTVSPTLAIGLGPIPDAGYTITGDYFKVATELVSATDTPAMPSQFHMIIVYRAMMYYGASEAASEVYQEGATEYKRMINTLSLNQLKTFTTGGALA
jgi:hypothetical protein